MLKWLKITKDFSLIDGDELVSSLLEPDFFVDLD